MNRRITQQAHEKAQVASFLEWFNRTYRCNFQVIAEPNPPEAIIRSGRTMRWVEVTEAFWNEAYARDEYSYATAGELHKPIADGPYMNMTQQFCENFVSSVQKKLEKTSYVPFKQQYGPGYLVVALYYPFFTEKTLHAMREAWSSVRCNDLGCFRGVYLSVASVGGSVPFVRWPL